MIETANVLAETRGVSFDEIARQTTANFFRLFSKVPRPAAADSLHPRTPIGNDAQIHHSRLRLFRRRAASGSGLGRLRSDTIRRTGGGGARSWSSAPRRTAAPHAFWSTPRPICASSCSTPTSIGSTACSTPTSTPTTPTALTTCALSSSSSAAVIDVYLDEPTAASLHVRFGYCFQRRPAATIRRS